MSLKEYLHQTYGSKAKQQELEVAIDAAPKLSNTEIIDKMNQNIGRCGIQMWNEATNSWEDPLTQEQLSSIRIPTPGTLSKLEKLEIAFAASAKEKLRALETEPIGRDTHYL